MTSWGFILNPKWNSSQLCLMSLPVRYIKSGLSYLNLAITIWSIIGSCLLSASDFKRVLKESCFRFIFQRRPCWCKDVIFVLHPMFGQTVHQPSEQASSPHANTAYLRRDLKTEIFINQQAITSLRRLSFSYPRSLMRRPCISLSWTLLLHL